jgi:ribonuclease E
VRVVYKFNFHSGSSSFAADSRFVSLMPEDVTELSDDSGTPLVTAASSRSRPAAKSPVDKASPGDGKHKETPAKKSKETPDKESKKTPDKDSKKTEKAKPKLSAKAKSQSKSAKAKSQSKSAKAKSKNSVEPTGAKPSDDEPKEKPGDEDESPPPLKRPAAAADAASESKQESAPEAEDGKVEAAAEPEERPSKSSKRLKRPAAAKEATKKRPSAASLPLKAYKYCYYADGKYGIKFQGREILTVRGQVERPITTFSLVSGGFIM